MNTNPDCGDVAGLSLREVIQERLQPISTRAAEHSSTLGDCEVCFMPFISIIKLHPGLFLWFLLEKKEDLVDESLFFTKAML